MRLLLSNDDGIEAAGLAALGEAVSGGAIPQVTDVWTFAPAVEQSAKSHSFTMREPLRVHQHAPQRFSVTGTPADAVYLALHGLMPHKPDLVLSGINRGSNLGTDVHYSGTVAAAREAVSHDIPAIAFSLHTDSLREADGSRSPPLWGTAIAIVRQLVPQVLSAGLPGGCVLNVNIPNLPVGEIRGIRTAPLSRRRYETTVRQGTDLRGEPYYWIGGPHAFFYGEPDGDGPLCESGWVTLTPLGLDITVFSALPHLQSLAGPCSTT